MVFPASHQEGLWLSRLSSGGSVAIPPLIRRVCGCPASHQEGPWLSRLSSGGSVVFPPPTLDISPANVGGYVVSRVLLRHQPS